MPAPALPTFDTDVRTVIPGFATVDDAAALLGCSTANVRRLIATNNFETVWKLGDVRPFYMLDRAEVERMADARKAPADA